MAWHASGALLSFAIFQIVGVIALAGTPGGSVLPFAALAILILVALPFSRNLERRWSTLANTALPSNGLVQRFRADRSRLWQLTLLVPATWIGGYMLWIALASG